MENDIWDEGQLGAVIVVGCITKPLTTDRSPTTDPPTGPPPTHPPPTTDSPTGPPPTHRSPNHRITDPITIDQQPFDSPILF